MWKNQTNSRSFEQNLSRTRVDIAPSPETTQTTMIKDSLDVPLVSPIPQTGYIQPFGMYGITPFDYGYATWQLHKGFNASIGLNLTFSPSKYAPS